MLQISLLTIIIFWTTIITYMAFNKRSWVELIVFPFVLLSLTYGIHLFWENITIAIIIIHLLLILWVIYKIITGVLERKQKTNKK